MKKAFEIWFALTFFALILFIIYFVFHVITYPFSNSSIDTVEELTFLDAMSIDHVNHYRKYPYPSAFEDFQEKLEAKADLLDIDIDKELFEALEDSKAVKDIEVEVVKNWSEKINDDSWASDIDIVQVKFTSRNLGNVKMKFLVADKSIIPPYSSRYLSLLSYSTDNSSIVNIHDQSTFLDAVYFRADDIIITEEDMKKYVHIPKSSD